MRVKERLEFLQALAVPQLTLRRPIGVVWNYDGRRFSRSDAVSASAGVNSPIHSGPIKRESLRACKQLRHLFLLELIYWNSLELAN